MSDNYFMKNGFAPIALFVYNRLDHTKKTVQALQKNIGAKDSILYIFSDGPKKGQEDVVSKLRFYLKTIKGFKKIIIKESKENKGLANSIIQGVTEVINKHNKIIVLEDDLVTRIDFLLYMNNGLKIYENRQDIYEIAGYISPKFTVPKDYKISYFLNQRPTSWGWSTWKDRWDQADWDVKDWSSFKEDESAIKKFNYMGDDRFHLLRLEKSGQISSWAIRWSYSVFKQNGLVITPTKSLVKNIGADGSGYHSVPKDGLNASFTKPMAWSFDYQIDIDTRLLNNYSNLHKWYVIEKLLYKTLRHVGYYKWKKNRIVQKFLKLIFS